MLSKKRKRSWCRWTPSIWSIISSSQLKYSCTWELKNSSSSKKTGISKRNSEKHNSKKRKTNWRRSRTKPRAARRKPNCSTRSSMIWCQHQINQVWLVWLETLIEWTKSRSSTSRLRGMNQCWSSWREMSGSIFELSNSWSCILNRCRHRPMIYTRMQSARRPR